MPPRDRGAARASRAGAGTFDDMYSGRGRGGGSVWARPRPELHAVGADEDRRELAPVLPRELDAAAVEKLYDAHDYVAPTLKTNDQAVYLLMVRRSYGAGRETCLVNFPLFTELLKMSTSGIQYVLRRLKAKGLIEAGEKRKGRQEQGVEYVVHVPRK